MNKVEYLNLFFTIVLVVLIGIAVYQGYFQERKCNNYCNNNFKTAMLEGPQGMMTCDLNWEEIHGS